MSPAEPFPTAPPAVRSDEPVRVLVDLTRLCADGAGGGITPALFGILRWLGGPKSPPFQFVYLTNDATRADVAQLARPMDHLRAAAEARADLASRESCGLVYCPFGYTDWACPGIPTLTLVVDLLHRDFPATLGAGHTAHREQALRDAVERTDLFQVISDYTAGRLQHHYAIPAERMVRTHLPVHARLTRPPAAREDFFFYPANAWAHKNHLGLLQAYARYRTTAGPAAWRLVLCGHHGSMLADWQAEAGRLGIGRDVDFLGYVDEAKLANLWSRAGALVFPSLHEGFGIPLLEAFHQGVPVIADGSTAAPEIAGDAALLVDARDEDALAGAMREVAGDPGLRQKLVAAGTRRLSRFEPDAEFGRLAQAMRTLAAGPARFRRRGYHSIDGLIEPLASFGLPPSPGARTVDFEFAPLGVDRTVEAGAGGKVLARMAVPAMTPLAGSFPLPPYCRSFSLAVPDAARLSPTDPRAHGTIVRRLVATGPAGPIDLLS